MNFKEWLIKEGSNPGAKTGLYPLGYGGIGLYPPSWYPTRSADAIFYLTIDERIYKGKDGGKFDITHLPPKSNEKMNAGDKGQWDITHLKGRPSHKIGKDYAAQNGDKGIWDISHLKAGPSYKSTKGNWANTGDGGTWDITRLKGRPSHKVGKKDAANKGEKGIWDISHIKPN